MPKCPKKVGLSDCEDLRAALKYFCIDILSLNSSTDRLLREIGLYLENIAGSLAELKNLSRSSVDLLEKVLGLISKSEAVQSPRLILESYKLGVLVLIEYKETDKCMKLLNTMKGVARWHLDPSSEMFAYEQLGFCANTCFNFEKAKDYYSKMLRLALNLRDKKSEFRAYDYLSKQFFYLNQPWMSNFFHKKVLEGDFEPGDSELRKLVIPDVDRRMGYNAFLISLPGYKSISATDFEALRLQALVNKDISKQKPTTDTSPEVTPARGNTRGLDLRPRIDTSSLEAIFESAVELEHQREMKWKKKLEKPRARIRFEDGKTAGKAKKNASGGETGEPEMSEYDRVMGKLAMNLQLHNNLKSGGFFSRIVQGTSSTSLGETNSGTTQSFAQLKDTLLMQNSNHQLLNHLSPNRNFRLYQQGAFADIKQMAPKKPLKLADAPAESVGRKMTTRTILPPTDFATGEQQLRVGGGVSGAGTGILGAAIAGMMGGTANPSVGVQNDFKVASYEIHLQNKSVERVKVWLSTFNAEVQQAQSQMNLLVSVFRSRAEQMKRDADRMREEEARDFAVGAIKSLLGNSSLFNNTENSFTRAVAQSQLSGKI